MDKYKFVLKGKGEKMTIDSKGNINLIIAGIMQFVCDISIANDITKKQFLEQCKESYEIVMKMMSEEGRND